MGESPKVEARLNPMMSKALELYMQDRHLGNESEVLRSALGKFLSEEGYLERSGPNPGHKIDLCIIIALRIHVSNRSFASTTLLVCLIGILFFHNHPVVMILVAFGMLIAGFVLGDSK